MIGQLRNGDENTLMNPCLLCIFTVLVEDATRGVKMLTEFDEIDVDNTIDFVKTFKLVNEFKKKYGLRTLNDWDWQEVDEDVITFFLEKMPTKYLVVYEEENNGYFRIFKLMRTDETAKAFIKSKKLGREFSDFSKKREIAKAI